MLSTAEPDPLTAPAATHRRSGASRAAVIGAGPAGFYATGELLKLGFEADLYDTLPTPFGLVRSGVAPDHPKIKTVTRVFEKIAAQPGFTFFGGVELGRDVSREDLLERYAVVVYAFGTVSDNRLDVPGEELRGCHSATDFVSWYNGHPSGAGHEFDLSGQRAVVIGNGNVAVDVARMLVLSPQELARTDVADHAIAQLEHSNITHVTIVGRRGPAQAAFTTPELTELGELSRATVHVDPRDMELDERSASWLASDLADITSKRNVEVLRHFASEEAPERSHRLELAFLWSPAEILGDERERVRGVRLVRNSIQTQDDGRLCAVPTGEERIIDCTLVLRSIGYRGVPLPGLSFDERRGLIRNIGGRVTDATGQQLPGEYAAGWIKRGPSGVIGTNKKCAAQTVERIREDSATGRLSRNSDSREAVAEWLSGRVDGLVTWDGWRAIDAHETDTGKPDGRPRVKLIELERMFAVAHGSALAR